MYAFDRKVDYIPYFDDEVVDTVSKVLKKHREKIEKRWIRRTFDSECILKIKISGGCFFVLSF